MAMLKARFPSKPTGTEICPAAVEILGEMSPGGKESGIQSAKLR